MESEATLVTTLEQRRDLIEAEKKPESSNESSTTHDVGDAQTKENVAQDEQATSDGPTHLSGVKMLSMLASLTLVFFLVLLDVSIISTVWRLQQAIVLHALIFMSFRPSRALPATFILSKTLDGTVLLTILQGTSWDISGHLDLSAC